MSVCVRVRVCVHVYVYEPVHFFKLKARAVSCNRRADDWHPCCEEELFPCEWASWLYPRVWEFARVPALQPLGQCRPLLGSSGSIEH